MDYTKETIGVNDQEVLIRALAMYVLKKIKASEGIIIGTFRMCIGECAKKYSRPFSDIRNLPESDQDAFYMDVADMVVDRMKLNLNLRRAFKYDCLQIYERWKLRNREPEGSAPAGAGVTEAPLAAAEKEKNLLKDLDSLDLDDIEGLDL